jgi:hypothetical protein
MQEATFDFKDLLKKFGEGKTKVVVRFDPVDPFTKNYLFKRGHRQMVEHLFETEHKLKVLRHAHVYDHTSDEVKVLAPGLIYAKTDSEIMPMIEVWGIVGESVGPIEA